MLNHLICWILVELASAGKTLLAGVTAQESSVHCSCTVLQWLALCLAGEQRYHVQKLALAFASR